MAPETSQTLDRGVRLMLAVADAPRGQTIAELADALELNRTVVHRLVATLAGHGLVVRDDRGRVVAGAAMVRLGQAARPSLLARTAPALRALADRRGATAHLTVAEGEEAVAAVVVEPRWSDVHVRYRVGARHRLADAAAGRAILLGRRDEAEERWTTSHGELQPGAHGLAVPVPRAAGLEASVGVVGLAEIDADVVGPDVVEVAAEVATVLG